MTLGSGRPDIMNDLLALAYVPRWVIVPHIGTQSVAEHSFRVAAILMDLALRLDLAIPYQALVWVLVHDGPEAWTGDIPGPFKAPNQDAHLSPWWHQFKACVPENWRKLVKVADLIETGTYIKKFGVGEHANFAANRILLKEVLEACNAAGEGVGYGPERLRQVVVGLIEDILLEEGRCNPT